LFRGLSRPELEISGSLPRKSAFGDDFPRIQPELAALSGQKMTNGMRDPSPE